MAKVVAKLQRKKQGGILDIGGKSRRKKRYCIHR